MNVTNPYSPSQGLIIASPNGFQQYTQNIDSYSAVLTSLYVSSFAKNNKYCIDSCWESGNIYFANYDDGYVRKIQFDGTIIATINLTSPSMLSVIQNSTAMNSTVTYPPQDDQGCWIVDGGSGKIIKTDNQLGIIYEVLGISDVIAIVSDIGGGCYVVQSSSGGNLIKISSEGQVLYTKSYASFTPVVTRFTDISIDSQGWIWFCGNDRLYNLIYSNGTMSQQFVLNPLTTDDPFSSSSSETFIEEEKHIGAIDTDRNNVGRHLYVTGGNSSESFVLKYNYSGVLVAHKQYYDMSFPYIIKVIQGMGSDGLYVLEDSAKWDQYEYGSSSSSSYVANWSSSSSSSSNSSSSSTSYIENWSSSTSSSTSSSSSYVKNWSSSSSTSSSSSGVLCWESRYPVIDNTHVLATTYTPFGYDPWRACDPSKSLTGSPLNNSWSTDMSYVTNQKYNIDLSNAYVVKRIYYENYHDSGADANMGVYQGYFYGTNSSVAFNITIYSDITDLTLLWSGAFQSHVLADVADPQYINIIGNNTPYRYYVFRFANNLGDPNYMGLRRIELQIECESSSSSL